MTRHARFVAVVVAAELAAIGTPVHAQDDGAFANLRARAEAGDTEAQYSLGVQFQFGNVVPQDLGAAETSFLRAAGQNHRDAQFILGLYFQGRNGEPRDDAERRRGSAPRRRVGHGTSNSCAARIWPGPRPD
jgi:TPR repeat protein